MKSSLKSGSALLIVLGMLSFMVVSAIGFSVFMRQNRLPSSFVRRNTAANQLVKAALARAMNELDCAIGDELFPGIETRRNKPMRGSSGYIDNTWKGRVFVGSTLFRKKDSKSNSTKLVRKNSLDNLEEEDQVLVPYDNVDDDYTVSTLTMEGLAYLPPCLVNEVRYFSQHAPSARWQRLGYDAGRFAYTAVNVSDYFDINKVPIAEQRSSSPTNRVSLAYLFADNGNIQKAEKFRDEIALNLPFVSLADLNLVLGYGGTRSVEDQINKWGVGTPFCDYAKGTTSPEQYYGTNGDAIKKMTLVTDSYFPEVESDGELLKLSNEKCQPFSQSIIEKEQPQLVDVYMDFEKNGRKFAKDLKEHLGGKMGSGFVANLYDYLDYDDIPLSLALPSVEQVPMIAGFKVNELNDIRVEMKRVVENGDPAKDMIPGQDGESRTFTAKYYLQFSDLKKLNLDVATMFPFHHAKCSDYKLEAAAQIVWGPESSDKNKLLKERGNISDASSTDLVVQGLLGESDGTKVVGLDLYNRYAFKNGYADIPEVNYPATEKDVFAESKLSLEMPSSDAGTIPFAIVNENWKCSVPDKKHPDNVRWDFENSELNLNEKDPLVIASAGLVGKDHNRIVSSGSYAPYLALRLRIKKGNKCVDLTPACVWDDGLNASGKVDDQSDNLADPCRAAFVFKGNGALDFSVSDLQGLTDVYQKLKTDKKELKFSILSSTNICPDPRWNHNVANWQKVEGSASDIKALVQSNITGKFNGQEGKDPDFFMTVSNQGWLQSISELALLPRTNNFNGSDTIEGSVSVTGGQDKDNFAKSLPITKEIADNQGAKYYICSENLDDDMSLESLFVDDTGGCRVNPYSDDSNIFKAALMYTPYDWSVAYSDDDDDDKEEFSTAIKKTFCSKSDIDSAKISQEEMDDLASVMQDKFAESNNGDWVEAYNKLKWGFSGESGFFEEAGLDNLTVADKKYLYGFWKGCFDARQQLFIIFVRAESALSGGGAGKGARAVAVVWRDPNPPKDKDGEYRYQPDNGEIDERIPPHKMRVLFYKALE